MIGILIIFSALSQSRAIVYSAILPGSADLLKGQKVKGLIHITAEGIIWGGAVWYNWNKGKMRNAYRDYAYLNAGTSPQRNDEEYLDAVERYRTAKEYNDYIENIARELYPDNITERDKYIKEHSIPPDEAWKWANDTTFSEYVHLRKSERFCKQMVLNMFGLAIFNRIIAVFSNTTVKKKNLNMGFTPVKDGYKFVVNWKF